MALHSMFFLFWPIVHYSYLRLSAAVVFGLPCQLERFFFAFLQLEVAGKCHQQPTSDGGFLRPNSVSAQWVETVYVIDAFISWIELGSE